MRHTGCCRIPNWIINQNPNHHKRFYSPWRFYEGTLLLLISLISHKLAPARLEPPFVKISSCFPRLLCLYNLIEAANPKIKQRPNLTWILVLMNWCISINFHCIFNKKDKLIKFSIYIYFSFWEGSRENDLDDDKITCDDPIMRFSLSCCSFKIGICQESGWDHKSLLWDGEYNA